MSHSVIGWGGTEQDVHAMDEEERNNIRKAREQEDMERFHVRMQARREKLDVMKERYDTSRNVNNRRNLFWLFFAVILAGGAWAVARFLASGYCRQLFGAGE